jgi:Flp pilus assembly protein TadG
MPRPTLRRYGREEHAQALIEFALMLPIFLLLVTGLFDTARAVWQENTLAYAAREGTRYAIVHGTGGSPVVGPCTSCVNPPAANKNLDQIVNAVTSNAIGVANITVTIDYPGVGLPTPTVCNYRTCPVTVDATAPFVPLPSYYLLGSAFQITLRGGSKLYIQR